MSHPTSVDYWFDPVCPFTWITSRWVTEVSQERSFTVNWNPFSLAELNGRSNPDTISEDHVNGHRMGRISAAISQQHDSAAVGRYYTALGERLHPGQRKDIDAVIQEALAEAGLSADLAGLADDETFDEPLVASTQAAIKLAGSGVGIPIIAVKDRAFFGPVMTPRPTGQAALDLWDAYLTLTSHPGFFELKRGTEKTLEF